MGNKSYKTAQDLFALAKINVVENKINKVIYICKKAAKDGHLSVKVSNDNLGEDAVSDLTQAAILVEELMSRGFVAKVYQNDDNVLIFEVAWGKQEQKQEQRQPKDNGKIKYLRETKVYHLDGDDLFFYSKENCLKYFSENLNVDENGLDISKLESLIVDKDVLMMGNNHNFFLISDMKKLS